MLNITHLTTITEENIGDYLKMFKKTYSQHKAKEEKHKEKNQ